MSSDSRISDQQDADHPQTGDGDQKPERDRSVQREKKRRRRRQPRADGDHAEAAKDRQRKPRSKPQSSTSKSVTTSDKGPDQPPDATPAAVASESAAPPDAASGPDNSTQPDAEEPRARHFRHTFLWFAAVPSWLVSMLLHVALLLILAFITLPQARPNKQIVAVSPPRITEKLDEVDAPEIEPVPLDEFTNDAPVDIVSEEMADDPVTMPEFTDTDAAPLHIDVQEFAEMTAPDSALTDTIGRLGGTGLQGRGAEARRAMVRKYGGTKGSEAAVANALQWFAAHQMRDGGWSFDHTTGPCKGRCSHPGLGAPSRNAATAMAILPFLGAGQTHKEGQYKANVEAGLAFLIKHMRVRSGMGDFVEAGGNMYSHGLASIAMCEAYAMTNDPGLLKPTQMALMYIVYAQDPTGGGWRYQPKQPGDTSVTGWQVMALKSGHMAYLKVPRNTLLGASRFLDFVQSNNGARYGYVDPKAKPSTTAVGLLCRMYLGWKKQEPALKAGVEYLHALGPSPNIYFDYYATQVMRQYGGTMWDEWNTVMREQLVKSQDKKDHAAGSWYFPRAPHGRRGGRLYCTSMAAMILEVYYRYMPLYGKEATEEEFPL